jgi:UPF0176 protein
MTRPAFKIAALYRFTPQADIPALRALLRAEFEALGIKGTILLAPEGINGTIAGTPAALDEAVRLLIAHTGLHAEDVKYSFADTAPFLRLKIREKPEIVTLRQPQADPCKQVGTYVAPQDWNALITDPDVLVLDTRNIYETKIGIFKGAVDPKIETFTQFVEFVRRELDPKRQKKIAMFCTGGIRCEKASSFMLHEGFEEVYHLKGGILKYLEDVPEQNSLWQGECYVFDRRMGVGHGLSVGQHSMCYCCGYPLSPEDRAHVLYEEGVSCAHCHATTSADDKQRYRMRQSQMQAGSISL